MSRAWRRASGVLWRQPLDGVAVLSPGGGEPVLLRGGAAMLWRALEHPAGVSELLEDLVAAGVQLPTDAVCEIETALVDLERRGLLERA